MKICPSPIEHVQPAIEWEAERQRWRAMAERHERERADFIRDLISRGATQAQVAECLGLERARVSRLVDYSGVVEKLVPMGTNSATPPSERELRPFVADAAREVAAERGGDRVREGREEVYERAAEKYEEAQAVPHVAHNSGNNEWYTPAEYIAAARQVLGEIDIDPASTPTANTVVGAKNIYTAEDDGLSQPWNGAAFVNPPYASELVGRFISKLVEEVAARRCTAAVVLVNNATETRWFAELVSIATAVVFPTARVRFWTADGRPSAPLQGQAVVYVGDSPDDFLTAFADFGWGASL